MDSDLAWIRTGAPPGADTRDPRSVLHALLSALDTPPPDPVSRTALIMTRLAGDGLVAPDTRPRR